MIINETLVQDLRQYILLKTGKTYFGRIKPTPKNIMVSCPYHKEGQERKPSCGIKVETDEKGVAGQVHCFTCQHTTNIVIMLQDILGDKYDENEIESRFGLSAGLAKENIIKKEKAGPIFKIPNSSVIKEQQLRTYRKYHQYLKYRNITEQTAEKYDIGYDEYNNHITFPIRDIYNRCIGIGRRSIIEKQYLYPDGMIKPLYGIYELPNSIRHVWVVEGPFNLWSLYQYGKTGVALLGTGTQHQYNELLKLECLDYVLALDGDSAGHKGILKLGKFLQENHKKVYVACVPNGQDINDMTVEQFMYMEVVSFNVWKKKYE